MNIHPPFHQGELKVQQLANEAAIGQRNGSVISDKIILGAIPFIAQQNMIVVSSLDRKGRVWASVLVGNAGFVHAPDASSMQIDKTKIVSNPTDPLWENIKFNPQVGVIAIELSTRRRLRVNGRIHQLDETNFEIVVEQAYPNCPKYIQRRSINIEGAAPVRKTAQTKVGTKLSPQQLKLIRTADSLFVGSASPVHSVSVPTDPTQLVQHGGDASHRGGFPGFIQVEGQTLVIPDYQGNSMFNTLGNIEVYPFVGVAIIDFERNTILQLSGRAKILWDQDDPANKSAGTKRFWELIVEEWQESSMPETTNWHFHDYSPHNPREKKPQEPSVDELVLKIEDVTSKSPRIKQYRLVPLDGEKLPSFDPGAHLPIKLVLPTGIEIERQYSILSSSNETRFYEIAVQRELNEKGGSNLIHDHFNTGLVVNAAPPRNEFPLSPIANHTILIAGGIGITAILSMVRELIEKNASFEIHYTARTEVEMAFLNEVNHLTGGKAHLYFTQETKTNRLDLRTLMNNASSQTHLFVCGPITMINAVRNYGEEFDWAPSRIHFESFGSVSSANDKSFDIKLEKSGGIVTVKPTQTILDALIDAKISVPYDCKRGECGMCVTSVIDGEIDHRDIFLNKQERTQQICVCVSRAKGQEIALDL